MTKRRGLGRGKGKGYYNLVARDPYIHGLSAKGVKTDYRRYDIYRFTRHAENPPDEEFGHKLVGAETIVTPVSKRDEFGEYMADEYGYQDYGNIVNFKRLLSNVSGEQIQELCKVYEKEASKLDAKKHISKELFEEKLVTAISNDERLEVLRSYRPLYAKGKRIPKTVGEYIDLKEKNRLQTSLPVTQNFFLKYEVHGFNEERDKVSYSIQPKSNLKRVWQGFTMAGKWYFDVKTATKRMNQMEMRLK